MNNWRQILAWQTRPDWFELANGYSLRTGNYTPEEWQIIGDWLLTERFTEAEVIQVLLSKHMRWAADNRAADNNPATLEDFKRYFHQPEYERIIREDAKKWATGLE